MKLGILAVALVAVAAVLYGCSGSSKPADYAALAAGSLKRSETGKGLSLDSAGKPAPDMEFVDATGAKHRIADFKGKPVMVNLWATWCAPCKIEMPTLAALQKRYEGKVEVLAVSIDKPEQAAEAKAFIAKNAPLAFYQEPTLAIPFAFTPPVTGFPTTIFYGSDGTERARLIGEADWGKGEAAKLVAAFSRD